MKNNTVGTTEITTVETDVTRSMKQESRDFSRGKFKNIDLATTISGDIYFESSSKNNSITLSYDLKFNDGFKPLCLSFYHKKNKIPDLTDYSLTLNLDYYNNIEKYKAVCISSEDVLKKRIEYIIRTTLTDLKANYDFGSDLELYIHKNLRDKSVIADIETVISKAVSSIVTAPTVKIVPKVKLMNNGYFQGIIIQVYDFNNLIFDYQL